MQEADKVVYFAHGETELKELPFEIQERDELILVFNSSSPKTAHSWLQHFRSHKTFRQQLANREHEDRIIRIISESAICLVFGGGGAHGLANLGVIKALNEYKIPVDIIGGSSVGSIIAGALSFDWEYERLHWSVKDSLSDHNPLNDYTLPFVALLRGRKMYRMLHKYFNLHFRDVWKNVFVVAANLSTSKTELIEDGPLDKAIAASISIPGILPPVLHKQGLLVDGGVLNNLPTDIMKRQYRGYVISVDVVSPQSRTIDHRYKVGNKQYLINLITGKRRNYVPGTMNTILKSITLGSLEQADSKAVMSDLYINPRAKKGFLAWKEFAAFEKEGYETAKRILSETDPKKLFNLK